MVRREVTGCSSDRITLSAKLAPATFSIGSCLKELKIDRCHCLLSWFCWTDSIWLLWSTQSNIYRINWNDCHVHHRFRFHIYAKNKKGKSSYEFTKIDCLVWNQNAIFNKQNIIFNIHSDSEPIKVRQAENRPPKKGAKLYKPMNHSSQSKTRNNTMQFWCSGSYQIKIITPLILFWCCI